VTARFCVCPYCGRRWSGEVDPDCLICSGDGVLELGAAGLDRHGAEVTARAVEYALEGQAQNALSAMNDREPIGIAEARASLRLCVLRLRRAGLLARRPQDRAALAQLERSARSRPPVRKLPADLDDGGDGDWMPEDRPRGGGGGRGFDLAYRLCSLRWVPADSPLMDSDELLVSSWADA
jgi:hypothetical protein